MAEEGATHFGTSAKFIDALRRQDLPLGDTYDLSALRTIITSGSALVEESFDYAYGRIKQDLHLAPASGGTDVMCGFLVPGPHGTGVAGRDAMPGAGDVR